MTATFEHEPGCPKLRFERHCTCGSTRAGRAWAAAIEYVDAQQELRRARHKREQLNRPLLVRTSDDVGDDNRDRWATDEEVAKWQAHADAAVAICERKVADILRSVGATEAGLVLRDDTP